MRPADQQPAIKGYYDPRNGWFTAATMVTIRSESDLIVKGTECEEESFCNTALFLEIQIVTP